MWHNLELLGRVKNTPDSKVHGAYMGPPGDNRTQVSPMLTPWTLLWRTSLENYYTTTWESLFDTNNKSDT